MKRKKKTKAKPRVKAGTSKVVAAARKAAFVEFYVQNGGNGTQAAISAGYSASRAKQTAAELVTDRDVSESINRRRAQALEKAQEKTGFTVEGVLRELHRIVHLDTRKLYKPDGSLKLPTEWDDETAAAISHMGRGGPVPFDKNAAIEKAMKYLGLFEKDNRQRSPLEGFTNDDARALQDWLHANRPPELEKKP